MPLAEPRKIVYAALEAAPGTAETITNADTAFYGIDPQYTPRWDLTEKFAAGSLSRYASDLGLEIGEVTLAVELYQGAAWAPILLPACGMIDDNADLSGTAWQFTDDTDDWLTATIGFNRAGKLYKLVGAMGTFEMVFTPGEPTRLNLTFLGRRVAEADAAQFSPAFTVGTDATGSPRFVSATTTLGGSAICFGQGTFRAGNTLEPLLCGNSAGGVERAWITDRSTQFTIDPLEELVANRNDDGIATARTLQAFSLAYSNMSLSVPKAQIIDITNGVRNGLSARPLTFLATQNSAPGDEFVLDVDTTD